MLQQLLGFVNDRRIALNAAAALPAVSDAASWAGRHIGHGQPLGLAADAIKPFVTGINERKKTIGPLLDRRRRGHEGRRCADRQDEDCLCKRRPMMHGAK